jgi:hypothetical protein
MYLHNESYVIDLQTKNIFIVLLDVYTFVLHLHHKQTKAMKPIIKVVNRKKYQIWVDDVDLSGVKSTDMGYYGTIRVFCPDGACMEALAETPKRLRDDFGFILINK